MGKKNCERNLKYLKQNENENATSKLVRCNENST